MKQKLPYHSALKPESNTVHECQSFTCDLGTAFVWDIMNGLPAEYLSCDLLYSEPSWMDGYEKFITRSGKTSRSYSDYLAAIRRIIENRHCPVVMILGKNAVHHLPKYDSAIAVKLNGYQTIAYAWGTDISALANETHDYLIDSLALRFDVVGDFCCGYGGTGLRFAEHGKLFVMSDINSKCVGQIELLCTKSNY